MKISPERSSFWTGAGFTVWSGRSSPAGELLQLTRDERLHGMEVLAKASKGKRPSLVLGVQGADTAEMLEYAAHAEKLEPDAMIAIPPTKKPRRSRITASISTRFANSTRQPVFVQTSGGTPGMVLSIDFMLELAREFPNFGYIKEEHEPVIARMKALIAKRPDPVKRVFGANFGTGWLYQTRLWLRRHHHGRRDVWRDLRAAMEPACPE